MAMKRGERVTGKGGKRGRGTEGGRGEKGLQTSEGRTKGVERGNNREREGTCWGRG